MKLLLIALISIFFSGCGANAPQPVSNSNSPAEPQRTERSETVIAHTTENQQAPMPNSNATGTKTKWSQSGDPIDTKELDAAIAAAKKSSGETAKKTLSEAYFKRAVALTEAKQYASALGDYRRSLKLDPSNEEAKQWVEQIINIYNSINKEYPKEGEEPPPLKVKSEK